MLIRRLLSEIPTQALLTAKSGGDFTELLFEFVFEFVFEAIGELFVYLMQLIVPSHCLSPKAEKRIKKIVAVWSGLVFLALIIGIIMLVQSDKLIVKIGKITTFAACVIIILQIIAGIACRIIISKNKQN